MNFAARAEGRRMKFIAKRFLEIAGEGEGEVRQIFEPVEHAGAKA
jgi:hypothetical protein